MTLSPKSYVLRPKSKTKPMLENLKKYQVILASKSPRRQELLRGMGVDFAVQTKETPETFPPEMPLDEVPKHLSLQKSLAFSDNELPVDYLLITADTVVICEGEILGKPKESEDAFRMLSQLSGKNAPCGDGCDGALGATDGVVCGYLDGDICNLGE